MLPVKPISILAHCNVGVADMPSCLLPRQRVTSYFLAHEAPEEPDATFFKQFEEVGARAVFAGLSKEDQDSYRHISEMELAGYSTYCLCREQRRSGGIADDDSSDDEEESFRRLSNEDTRDFIVLVLQHCCNYRLAALGLLQPEGLYLVIGMADTCSSVACPMTTAVASCHD